MDKDTQQEITSQITALIGRLTLENVSLSVRIARLENKQEEQPRATEHLPNPGA